MENTRGGREATGGVGPAGDAIVDDETDGVAHVADDVVHAHEGAAAVAFSAAAAAFDAHPHAPEAQDDDGADWTASSPRGCSCCTRAMLTMYFRPPVFAFKHASIFATNFGSSARYAYSRLYISSRTTGGRVDGSTAGETDGGGAEKEKDEDESSTSGCQTVSSANGRTEQTERTRRLRQCLIESANGRRDSFSARRTDR